MTASARVQHSLKALLPSRSLTVVVLFALLALIVSPSTFANQKCSDVFRDTSGPELLRKYNPQLHLHPLVERTARKIKSTMGQVLQKPLDKITAWLLSLEATHRHLQKHPQAIVNIKQIFYNQYVIDPKNIPESYFQAQARIARELGHGDVTITKSQREQYVATLIADQKSTLDRWIDYLLSADSNAYPMWTKFWILQGMARLGRLADPDNFVFEKRDLTTVAPFADLNREAVAFVVDVLVQRARGKPIDSFTLEMQDLVKQMNFAELYAHGLKKARGQHSPLNITQGTWVKYPQGTNPTALVKSLDGKGTGWCTAGESTAKTQLKGGDFYVYYSNDAEGSPTMPRIAIRMNGTNQIAEIRGIAKDQHLDPHIADTDVLKTKLTEFGGEGERYHKRNLHMKKLTALEKRTRLGVDLDLDELRFLYEIDEKIEGFGYEKDPRIADLIKSRDLKADLAKVFQCRPDQISTTKEEALSGDIVYHYGDLDLYSLDLITGAQGLVLPKHIGGSLALRTLDGAKGLVLPEHIGGSLALDSLTSAQGLVLPKHIGGDLVLSSLTSAKGLVLPEHIGGILSLYSLTSAQGLTFPKHIGGKLDLRSLTSAKGITFPQHIGGDLVLSSLKSAQGLVFPLHIGGSLFFYSLKSAQGLILPNHIGGDLYVRSMSILEGIALPPDFPKSRIKVVAAN